MSKKIVTKLKETIEGRTFTCHNSDMAKKSTSAKAPKSTAKKAAAPKAKAKKAPAKKKAAK